MWKTRLGLVFREFFRSFRHHLFTNVLLIVLFGICFYLVTVLVTFFFDVEGNKNNQYVYTQEGQSWYRVLWEEDPTQQLGMENDGLERIRQYYHEARSSRYYESFIVSSGPTLFEVQSWQERMDDAELEQFQYANVNPMTGEVQRDGMTTLPDGEETAEMLEMKTTSVDPNAFAVFGWQMESGEKFTEENTTMHSAGQPIPVILGSGYREYFALGDRLRVNFAGQYAQSLQTCRVIGFLQENSLLTGDLIGTGEKVHSLDYDILLPNPVQLDYVPATAAERTCWVYNYMKALSGLSSFMVLPKEGFSHNEVEMFFGDLGREYGMPVAYLQGIGFGMELLRSESRQAITIILTLSVVVILFTLFCLVSSFLAKMQVNLRTYAIYLCNGSGLGQIMAPCLLEMAVLLLPGLAMQAFVFGDQSARASVFLGIAGAAGGLLFVGMALFIFFQLRGINTEQLMRRKD